MPNQPENTSNNVTLVDEQGKRRLYIAAAILPNGDLQVSGQDLSEDLKEIFGEHVDEYEYWLTVPSEHKNRLLLALLDQLYHGDPSGDSKLRAVLEAKSIPHKFDSYM